MLSSIIVGATVVYLLLKAPNAIANWVFLR